MDVETLLRELESRGSAQTRKTYGRHGVRGPMFGVSYKDLGILTRRLKTNHSLALELWETENHDARILATMIADPATLKAGEWSPCDRDDNPHCGSSANCSMESWAGGSWAAKVRNHKNPANIRNHTRPMGTPARRDLKIPSAAPAKPSSKASHTVRTAFPTPE